MCYYNEYCVSTKKENKTMNKVNILRKIVHMYQRKISI